MCRALAHGLWQAFAFALVWLLTGYEIILADACSRVLYESGAGSFFTGRTMDWYEDTNTNLWAFPRGMRRNGGLGKESVDWISKYGSVVASLYEFASGDGMNEAGLVANLLYLAEADYGSDKRDGQKMLSVGAWIQYILDNFGTVSEAVGALSKDDLNVVAPDLPSGKKSGVHVALSDANGDSAILEYLKGRLTVHHGPEFRVMTNSPPYDRQLAIAAYWQEVGGFTFLPGTHRAADRFARLNYNLNAVPKVSNARDAIAVVFSIIRHISVPLGIVDPEKPNLASTLWRTVSDHSGRRFIFESVRSPSAFWVDLGKLDLSEVSTTKRLKLDSEEVFSGDISTRFEVTEPFAFMKPGPNGRVEL